MMYNVENLTLKTGFVIQGHIYGVLQAISGVSIIIKYIYNPLLINIVFLQNGIYYSVIRSHIRSQEGVILNIRLKLWSKNVIMFSLVGQQV